MCQYLCFGESLFSELITGRELNPAGVQHTVHVCFSEQLIHRWLRVLGSSFVSHQRYTCWHMTSRNYKESSGMVGKWGRTVMYRLYSAGTDGPLLLITGRSLTYNRHNLFPVICTATRAFLEHRYCRAHFLCTHTHTQTHFCSYC